MKLKPCPDFQVHPQLEGKHYENFLGLIESDVEGMAEASFYDGELVLPPRRQLTEVARFVTQAWSQSANCPNLLLSYQYQIAQKE